MGRTYLNCSFFSSEDLPLSGIGVGRLLGTSGSGCVGRLFKAFSGALTFDFSESIGELEDAAVSAAFVIFFCFISLGFCRLEGIGSVDCRAVCVCLVFWVGSEMSKSRKFRIHG